MSAIAIADAVLVQIYAQARAAFPHECCGYLVGQAGQQVDAAIACRNAQADGEHPTHPERGPETGFVISGRELFEFARAFASATPPQVVYHSHTSGHAYFSAVDRANAVTPSGPAYPVQHLVIGVTAEGPREAAQFAWSVEEADFLEVARWDVRC